MFNLLISITLSASLFVGLFLPEVLEASEALVPAICLFFISFLLLYFLIYIVNLSYNYRLFLLLFKIVDRFDHVIDLCTKLHFFVL